ncbi:hypothetical protein [Winogradskyella arenosi]|uniref:Uncharacterized protein n=1 Tax=Winogradskyella arenosi TaxID=533325 RepID=A0A368ZET7_9FLAO|nr:hypothetical protein [Winogradskyella arenosi]RCW92034.1 hypothetical protein DFQ08_10253 [Winogradskyella arenosi]
MKKQVLIHLGGAVLLSILLYKLASFPIENAMSVGFGTAFLSGLYAIKRFKK